MIYGVKTMIAKKPVNYKILKRIMSKLRMAESHFNTNYAVLYAFFYKYCSDSIKDFLMDELKDKELTIDEAYRNKISYEQLLFDSLHMNGFFIKKSDAFIDELVNSKTSKRRFLEEFLGVFPRNIIFNSEYHNLKYFKDFFNIIREGIDISQLNDSQVNDLCEIIVLISRLEVTGDEFPFEDVFDIVSASRFVHVNSNPELITQILSKLVVCEKKSIDSAYDPFIKNGDTLMKLREEIGYELRYCYGKDSHNINYVYNVVKFFISNFSLNNVFLKREDAFDSIDFNGRSFDAILSRIPISIKNYHTSNFNQSMEIAKRNKRSEVENLLLEKLDITEDSFKQNLKLNQALENLVEEIGFEDDSNSNFKGQYESLQDSEFLFLINLIEALKNDGIMTICISENFLFKPSLEILRKYLTLEKNYIDTVIRVPNEFSRSRPEVVMVFKKNRQNSDVLFIDMSSDYETQRSRLTYPGLFRKNLVLDDETLSKMENVFLNKLSIDKYSNLISIDEIENNQFNLSVSRYVDTFDGEFISLDDLVAEKQEIDSNINELDIKIEKMMDELGIRFK